MKGRSFGNISYAAQESARADDLRRRATGAVAADVRASCPSIEHRDTGARKRVNGA